MPFGVTDQGFVGKRLADIKLEIETSVRSTFGSGVNLDPRGPFGQLIGIFSEREALLWELAEAVYNGYWPQTAKGTGLDNALSLVGLTRQPATFSFVTIRFFALAGTVIPTETLVSRSDNSTIVFRTRNEVTVQAGTGTNEEQTISFSAVPDAGVFSLDFDGQITASIPFSASAATVQAELESLSNIGVGNVSVSGNFSTGFTVVFQSALGEAPQVSFVEDSNTLTLAAAPVVLTIDKPVLGVFPSATVVADSTVSGSVPAPATTLSVLDSAPIGGLQSITNDLDAEIGDEIETDADAKARRNLSVANPGNATIEAIRAEILSKDDVVAVRLFENTSIITDQNGRPAKSYEAVVQGGSDADIGRALFDTKPAGIEQFGSVVVPIVDSVGVSHDQRFSRPTSVPIYVEVDLTTDSEFPVDGVAQVEAAILAYGNSLNISDDVIVVPRLVCALDDVPGILDIDVRISTASIPTAGSLVTTFSNDLGDLLADTSLAHGLAVGNRVTFINTGGSLPTGLNANDVYWVVSVPSGTQLKVSLERGGDAIGFVDAGSGTNTTVFGGRDDNILITDTERADFDSSRITAVVV